MSLNIFSQIIPALPEIFLASSALILLMVGVFMKRPNDSQAISYASIVCLSFTTILLLSIAGDKKLAFDGLFVADEFSTYLKCLVIISSVAIILVSKKYRELQDINLFEFPILIMLAVLGMMMMISANDLLGLYLGIELQSLSLYVVASLQRDSSRSAEAGLKYFVLGALSSGLMLYGISFIYGFAGSTSFEELARVFEKSSSEPVFFGVTVGLVFILAGFAFKISAVPFHMWTPDVYEGAPTPATALFSLAPKIAAIGLLIRTMLGPFNELGSQWQQIILFVSVSSMVLGAFAAINQTNIKRLLAYSSIAHMGYALIGLVVAGSNGSPELQKSGLHATLIYLSIYVFMNLGTFTIVLLMKRNNRMVEGIEDLAGLSKTHPGIAMVLSIFMFSMAGIPPLAGFIGKLYIFESAINAEFYFLAIIGLLASVVGAFYYIRIVKIIYFDNPAEPLDLEVGIEVKSVLIVCGLISVFLIVYPLPLYSSAEQATLALFSN